MKAGPGRSLIQWAVAVVFLIAAALIWQQLPNKLQSWAPITVQGKVGERIEAREFAVTVEKSILASAITYGEYGEIRDYPGTWVVVVVTYETLTAPARPQFELEALGNRYPNYRQAHDAVEFHTTGPVGEQPGLPKRGVIAFELPTQPEGADLLVTNKSSDKYGEPLYAPLDSQVSIRLNLTDPPQPRVDLDTLEDRAG
jgi:hypothetical protein